MASHFESVPCDVLQHIAFLLASSSVLEPPHHLINLLLTSSTIYRSLKISNCPHLYANIFRTKFDLVANIHGRLTDSALAVELLCRCRVLGRAGRRDLSFKNSRQDLLAALRMILESRGLNKTQLSAAGFPEFILSFVLQHLSHDTDCYPSGRLKQDTNALAIWLLCFTISHRMFCLFLKFLPSFNIPSRDYCRNQHRNQGGDHLFTPSFRRVSRAYESTCFFLPFLLTLKTWLEHGNQRPRLVLVTGHHWNRHG